MLTLGPHLERAIMTDFFLYTACRVNAILALDEPVAQVYQVNTGIAAKSIPKCNAVYWFMAAVSAANSDAGSSSSWTCCRLVQYTFNM